MKSTLSFSLFILIASSAFGQTLKTGFLKNAEQNKQHRLAIMQFMQRPVDVASKSPSTEERVIASSLYNNAGLTDTIHLTYSGNRGSEFDYNQLRYDFYANPYDGNPMFEFNGHINEPQVLSDTLTDWTAGDIPLSLSENVFSSYNDNNNLTLFTDIYTDTINNHDIKYLNVFNSDNNVTASYSFSWNGNVWDSLGERYFSYNASKLLMQDSTYAKGSTGWSLMYKNAYAYNSSGDLVQVDNYNRSSSWVINIEYVNTYNSSHQLISVVTNTLDVHAMYVDSFSYVNGISYQSSWTEYSPGLVVRYLKHFNATGLPDTAYVGDWDTITHNWISGEAEEDIFNYDAYNEPVNGVSYSYLDTSFNTTPGYMENFYYETYSPTNVKNITDQDDFVVYPNPSSDKIFISQKNAVAAKSLQISIVNVSGQRVLTETLSAANKTEEISVAGFTPGTYWLTIQDLSGNILHKQAVVRQ